MVFSASCRPLLPSKAQKKPAWAKGFNHFREHMANNMVLRNNWRGLWLGTHSIFLLISFRILNLNYGSGMTKVRLVCFMAHLPCCIRVCRMSIVARDSPAVDLLCKVILILGRSCQLRGISLRWIHFSKYSEILQQLCLATQAQDFRIS